MRIAITGGCGMIAGYLCQALASEHSIVLLDRVLPPENDPFGRARLPIVLGEATDGTVCERAFRGADAIVHFAGLKDPTPRTFFANGYGSYTVFEAAHAAGVGRVVQASSINVLGLGWHVSEEPISAIQYLPWDDDHPLHPTDSYSLGKLVAEEVAAAYARAYSMRTASLRFSVVREPEWTATWHQRVQPARERPRWPWPWVDVRDVVQALERALTIPDLPAHGGYFIGADDTSALEPTMQLVERFFPEWLPKVRSLPGHTSLYDCRLAKEVLGFQPRHQWRSTSELAGRAT
ncbi:MAG: NAD-dependent epimerase/dehydratase family protein [Chloroflexota bacterium]